MQVNKVSNKTKRIWMVTPEFGRVAKKSSGGISDAAYGMTMGLAKSGCTLSVILPKHVGSIEYLLEENIKYIKLFTTLNVPLGGTKIESKVFLTHLPLEGTKQYVSIYLIDTDLCDQFGNRSRLYGYKDDAFRFLFFNRATAELYKYIKRDLSIKNRITLLPNIIQTHDWMGGFTPFFFRHSGNIPEPKFIHTIHNLGYGMGLDMAAFSEAIQDHTPWIYSPKGMEFYGKIDANKTSILFSDRIIAVSPTYAEEIVAGKSPAPADRYAGILQARKDSVLGILNGLPEDFGPDKFAKGEDALLPRSFSAKDISGKMLARRKLQNEFGLEVDNGKSLLVAITGRWAEQKATDLVMDLIPKFMEGDQSVQFAIVGSGTPDYFKRVIENNALYPGKYFAHGFESGFSDSLEALVLAGSDVLLMPSRFEPCGLAQMKAQKLGTLPIVHAVGGLKDTIVDKVNGFAIEPELTSEKIFEAVMQAVQTKRENPAAWEKMVISALETEYSWLAAAKKYIDVYNSVLL